MQFVLSLNEYILNCQEEAKKEFQNIPLEADVDLVVDDITGEVKVVVDIRPRKQEQIH